MELLHTFGIEWKLFIAQIINFLVLLYILKRFAYKPILKVLEERREKIEKGLKDTEEAHKRLKEIAEKEKEVLVEARKQAQEIIAKAESIAIVSKDEIIADSKKQAERIMEDTRKGLEREKNQMLSEVKEQVASMVISATSKMIDEKMDSEKDKNLIDRTIK